MNLEILQNILHIPVEVGTNPGSLTTVTSCNKNEKTEIANAYAAVTTATTVTSKKQGSRVFWEFTAWRDDFGSWALEDCVFRDRYFWNVRHLHERFTDWCMGRDLVPCTRETFDELLRDERFYISDNLIHGLTPRDVCGVCFFTPCNTHCGGVSGGVTRGMKCPMISDFAAWLALKGREAPQNSNFLS